MANMQAFAYLTNICFVAEAVRLYLFTTTDAKPTVSVFVTTACPHPTVSRLIYLFLEPLERRSGEIVCGV
jgi:hypothetical protein